MKKTIILILVITLSYSCKAQIVPIEKMVDYIDEGNGVPENTTYIKDVNNLLDKFVGVWKGSADGKTFELRIVKYTEDSYGIKEDLLLMRHIIKNSNGTVIKNTTTLANSNVLVSSGNYLEKNGTYVLNYVSDDEKCGQTGDIFINVTSNQMLFSYNKDFGLNDPDECPNGKVPQIFPKVQFTLTKQ